MPSLNEIILIVATLAALALFYKYIIKAEADIKISIKRSNPFQMEDDLFKIKTAIKKARNHSDLERCARAIWAFQSNYTGLIADQYVNNLIAVYEEKDSKIAVLN